MREPATVEFCARPDFKLTMTTRHSRWVWLLLVSASTVAWAQGGASILGTVIDTEDKQPFPHVYVWLTTQNPFDTPPAVETDAQGNYHFTDLPPGIYTLHFHTGVPNSADRELGPLQPGQVLRVDIALVDPNEEDFPVAEVGRSWPTFDMGSPSTSEPLEEGFTDELARHRPARDVGGLLRSFDSSLELFAGTRVMANGLGLHGASPLESDTLVDGLSTMDPAYSGNALPLPESFVEDLILVTSGALPDSARAVGANIAASTPTGGTRLHGTVFTTWTPGMWEGHRSRPQFATGQARDESLHQLGDLGGIVGGPLIKHRKLTFMLGAIPTFRRMAVSSAPSSEDSLPSPPSTSNFLDRRAVQVMGKLDFSPSWDENLTLSFITLPITSDALSPFTGALVDPAPVNSTVTRTSLSWLHRRTDTRHLGLLVQVGWLHRITSRDWETSLDTPSAPTLLKGRSEDGADRYQASVDLNGRYGAHWLAMGLTGEYLVHDQRDNTMGSTPSLSDPIERYPLALTSRTRGQVIGASLQDEWSPVPGCNFSLTSGLRYDLQRLLSADGGPPIFTGSRVSPRLGMTYLWNGRTRVFAQYGMAMSQVPLRLVETHALGRDSTTASLVPPSSRDAVIGVDTEPWFDTRLSLQYLHRALGAPIDSVWSATPPRDRSYNAFMVVLGHNNAESLTGLKLLLSYTWSRLTEEGKGRVRLSPTPDSVATVFGPAGKGDSAPVDRPHTVKACVAWAQRLGPKLITRVGLSYLGESGAWMSGAPQRLDWNHSLDAFVSLATVDWGDRERFTGGVDVFNLLNFQTVTRTDVLGAPAEYQQPRQIRIQARYAF
ncbi:TonB-dependent receptor [Myxococcaceae bacterium JPH2]|nr:TonB-dependent receptor [Myxococcaceae bacterium JPH2]